MNVENIGGVIEPVGNNAKQKLIAKIMQSKFCFGGGKLSGVLRISLFGLFS